jgi:hypothetical protein
VNERNQNRDQTASATCETAFDRVHQMANLSLSFVDVSSFPRWFPRAPLKSSSIFPLRINYPSMDERNSTAATMRPI